MDLGVISLVLLLLAIILGFSARPMSVSYPSFLPSSWGALRA